MISLLSWLGNFLWYNGVGQNITASIMLAAVAIVPARKAVQSWREHHHLTLKAHHDKISAELTALAHKIETMTEGGASE
jgi:hypothetical protein